MYLTCFRKFLNSPLEYKTLTKIVYRKKEKWSRSVVSDSLPPHGL